MCTAEKNEIKTEPEPQWEGNPQRTNKIINLQISQIQHLKNEIKKLKVQNYQQSKFSCEGGLKMFDFMKSYNTGHTTSNDVQDTSKYVDLSMNPSIII